MAASTGAKKARLSRSLGVPMLAFYGTGMILGAGIYSVIGKAAGQTGDSLWLAFLLAALSALLTAFSYAELSTMFPKAGAEFTYLRHAFPGHQWLGTTAGAAMALSGAATAATVAIAFSGYLAQFAEIPRAPVAAGLLLVFTGVAILGVRASGWTNVVFTLIEVAGLVLIIWLGITSGKLAEAARFAPHAGTLSGAALIVFSYFGFENIVNLAEETKRPERALPKAILLSLAVASVLYLLVSLSAVALLPVSQLARSDAALMDVARASSRGAGNLLGAIALFSTANTALISMVGASRILFGMGREKAIPAKLATVLPRTHAPWLASLAVLATALLLLPLGRVESVAGVSALATMVAFLLVNIAVLRLRSTRPQTPRPFRAPLSLRGWPLTALLGAAISALFLLQFERNVYLVGIPVLSAAAAFFAWREGKVRLPARARPRLTKPESRRKVS